MKASSANLLTLIKGPKQFIIPIYQRTYSWQIRQCAQLWADIMRIGNDDSSQGHFVGSIVYFQESIHTITDVPKLLVIDGQQRLTTVSILIAAIANFLRNNKDVEIGTNVTKLENYYLLNPEEEGDLRQKLLLTRTDKDVWFQLLKGVDISNDCTSRVLLNYNYFYSLITKDNIGKVYNGILRLFVVDVALEKGKDNPQLIFESMNSTGLDLSQADLIRNFILMDQEHKLQNDLYEKFWYPMEQSFGAQYTTHFNSFMRDFLSVKTGVIPRMDQVYDSFKVYSKSILTNGSISYLVEDLATYSKHYVNIVLHKESEPRLKSLFYQLSALRVDVCYPFLLPVYNDYKSGLLSEYEIFEIVECVINYVFRRAICGIPTNSLNKTFVTLYKSVTKYNYLEGVKAAFLLLDSYKRFPNDIEFRNSLVVKDVYNFRNRNYMFGQLENLHRKEFVNISDYTIEHIMPQNKDLCEEWQSMLGDNWAAIQENYLHTIGNLTLTGYNSELSDLPFPKKKSMEGGFDDSPIRLNDYIKRVNEWNEQHIQQRASELANKALDVWKYPLLDSATLDKYKGDEKSNNLEYAIDHYEYLTGDMLLLFNALKQRILNISSLVKVEHKKLYIAFKVNTNFVDVVPQKNRLRLSLNMHFNDIIDDKGICRDVTNLGRWGNGDVEVGISDISELDYIMELIEQAYNLQIV